jgi:glutamate carboxypeptidase
MPDVNRALIEFCRAEGARLRRDIDTLVRLESPSTDKAAVDRCGAAVARILEEAGATVTRLPQVTRGDHIRAEFSGGPRTVMVLGHFDTVWDVGTIARMPLREDDGRLYGPGVFDMKASIAIAALAVRALSRLQPDVTIPRVVMLWTTDEEIGSATSRTRIEEEARGSDAVLVLEPSLPGGAVKTSRKGCGEFELVVRGVSAHAGIDPRKGASAIHELAHQIVALQRLSDPEHGVSLNVGVIAGGSRGNVIAEEARATIDLRVATLEDGTRLEGMIRGLSPVNPAVRLEVSGGVGRPPLERTAAVIGLYQEAKTVAAQFGVLLGEGGTGGGSDGNFTAALGVPTLDGLGPQGDGAHALHEHVVIADLAWRAAFLAALMHRLNAS